MKILTIQSDEEGSLLFKDFLGKAGFEVNIAKDGRECLGKMLKNQYEAVLLNSMIPVIDGFEVIKRFRESGKKQGKIIVTTNLLSDIAINEAFKVGADGYEILTQVTPEELIAKIKGYVSGEITREQSKLDALKIGKKFESKYKREGPEKELKKVTLEKDKIVSFLRFIRKDKEIGAIESVNEDLDKGKNLKEIFKKESCIFAKHNKKMFGNFIEAWEIGSGKYKIGFGCLAGPELGAGGEWIVKFDSKNNVAECKKVEDWVS
jgi:DNA-binding response OmpR family regulator